MKSHIVKSSTLVAADKEKEFAIEPLPYGRSPVVRVAARRSAAVDITPIGRTAGVGATPAELSIRLNDDRANDARESPQPLGGFPKRAMDVAIASIALVMMAPIMLITAALVRFFLGGPAVFAQHRVGFDGRIFVCYKFRTMVVNAEGVLRRHLAADPLAAREWLETRKLRNDPRVGWLGNVLRKSSLDELPQLFNVLRGDMSLVGPRPVVPEEIACYGRHARACFKARPGLTGMWQTSGRNRTSYAARVACDRYYARHWSLWLDVVLLIKTVPAVMNFDQTA